MNNDWILLALAIVAPLLCGVVGAVLFVGGIDFARQGGAKPKAPCPQCGKRCEATAIDGGPCMDCDGWADCTAPVTM